MAFDEPIRGQGEMDRRKFFARSFGLTAGLALVAFPGIMAEALALQGDRSKEEILKELEAKADKFMPMLKSCSMASFAALNEQFDMKADQTIPALLPFTGGIALKGETCGAVSGSLLALGFYFESMEHKAKQQAGSSFKLAGLFFDKFEKEFGSTRCREVVNHQFGRYYNFLDPEEQKSFMADSQKSGGCMEVVKKAIRIAGDIILEKRQRCQV